MARKVYSNRVIPEYIPQAKYKDFAENKDNYLKNLELVNFEIVNNLCKSTSLQNFETFYKLLKERT